MTYTDEKPKRKRSPHRRRRFLLWIVMPVLIVIGGFVLLSPQIEAWLATDPFTPQCHFEQDRLFATGYPTLVSSINTGQNDSFGTKDRSVGISWSPNGNYLTIRDDSMSNGEFNTFIASQSGDIQYALGRNIYGGNWSPNSRYISYQKIFSNHILDMQSRREIPFLPSNHDGFRQGGNWSPNSRYLPFVLTARDRNDDNEFDTWIIKDMENPKVDLRPWETGIVNSKLIGWSNDSQFAYFIDEYHLYEYSTSQEELTNRHLFPYQISPPDYPEVRQTTAKMSPDGSKILLSLEDKFTIVVHLEEFEVRQITSFQPPERILWHPDSEHLVTIDGSGHRSTKTDNVLLYNIDDDTITHLNTKSADDIDISPTGRFISYVEGKRNFYAKTRRIFELETSNDVLLADFKYWNQIQWLYHDGKEYVVIQQAINTNQDQPLLTYLIDPENMSKCKIGWTGYELEFQPQEQ